MITSSPREITIPAEKWVAYPNGDHSQFRAVFCKEDDGGFSVRAACLAGVISEGDTIEQATENIKEAFKAVIECYKEQGEEIPWKAISRLEDGCFERWVSID